MSDPPSDPKIPLISHLLQTEQVGGRSRHERPGDLDRSCWHQHNSGVKLQRVGTRAPNALGLYDMLGNVRALVWSFVGTGFTQHVTPQSRMIHRGTSFQTPPAYTRFAARQISGVSGSADLGFRIVRTIKGHR